MCGKVPESIAYVLGGCSSLTQTKKMDRHNATLKVQFFEMLRDLKLVDSFPPWYSRVDPKQSEDHNRMLVSTQNTLSFEPTGWTHNL